MQKFIFLALLSGSVVLGACHGGMVRKGLTQAEVTMAGAGGATVSGRVSFAQIADRVRVIADVQGLTPGAYVLDLLESGDCSALASALIPAAPASSRTMSAALGDLPALIANSQGLGKLSAYLDQINLDSDQDELRGRQLVIRAAVLGSRAHKFDNAGKVVACGIVKAR